MIKPWIKASRLPSQTYIFFPLLLGQSMAYYNYEAFNIALFFIISIFSLSIQLFIVYANDFADYEFDKNNNTYNVFSGGSRVLVEGLLKKSQLKKAIMLTIASNLMIGLVLTVFYNLDKSLIFVSISMLLLYLYSYSPIKLSYRGGGEFLQTLGVILVLPLFSYYVQLGSINSFNLILIACLIPIHLSSAISTGLPDNPSDTINKKNTISVLIGINNSKILIIILNFLTIISLLIYNIYKPTFSNIIIFASVIINLLIITKFKKSMPGNKDLLFFIMFNIINIIIILVSISLSMFL